MILSTNDFKESFKITTNQYTEPYLIDVILETESTALKDLLGLDLYNLFIADVNANNGVPSEPRFFALFNEFEIDVCFGVTYRSEGIKTMLKCFTWYFYIRNNNERQTMSGTSVDQTSLGAVINPSVALANRYNQGVRTYQAIQEYIWKNSETYPEYKGRSKKKTLFF